MNIVIGLGTGRCGTQSLARLLDQQIAAEVHHEKGSPQHKWMGSENEVQAALDWMMERPDMSLVGDVASYYLPYVDYVLTRYPTAKFVCLQRDCAETVQSFTQITPTKNHWMDHQGAGWQLEDWDSCFPNYDVPDKQSAIMLYWYDYYRQAIWLQAHYPDSFRIYPTESLNSAAGQRAILAFLGIPDAQMKLSVGIRTNTVQYKRQRMREEVNIARRQRLKQRIRNIWILDRLVRVLR